MKNQITLYLSEGHGHRDHPTCYRSKYRFRLCHLCNKDAFWFSFCAKKLKRRRAHKPYLESESLDLHQSLVRGLWVDVTYWPRLYPILHHTISVLYIDHLYLTPYKDKPLTAGRQNVLSVEAHKQNWSMSETQERWELFPTPQCRCQWRTVASRVSLARQQLSYQLTNSFVYG